MARPVEETQEYRLVRAHDLVAAGDVARRSGWTVGAVDKWTRRYDDAPRPVAITSAGALYLWSEWEPWLARTGRLRPPAEG